MKRTLSKSGRIEVRKGDRIYIYQRIAVVKVKKGEKRKDIDRKITAAIKKSNERREKAAEKRAKKKIETKEKKEAEEKKNFKRTFLIRVEYDVLRSGEGSHYSYIDINIDVVRETEKEINQARENSIDKDWLKDQDMEGDSIMIDVLKDYFLPDPKTSIKQLGETGVGEKTKDEPETKVKVVGWSSKKD